MDHQNEFEPFTALKDVIKIPWDTTFRLGSGVNALTGESTGNTALQPFEPEETFETRRGNASVEMFHWHEDITSHDEYSVEAGATINAACPTLPDVSLYTKVASSLSEESSSSTILVEVRESNDRRVQRLPINISLQEDLEEESGRPGFREKYGDYYVSGCEYRYTFRMIVVCKVESGKVTTADEDEARMLVGNLFRAGGDKQKSRSKSRRCKMLRALIETFGCSADASRLPKDIAFAGDSNVLDIVPNIFEGAKGTPQIAFLSHYSKLKSAKLSPRLDIPKYMFSKASESRNMYITLKAAIFHPALTRYADDRETINTACQAFEEHRSDLLRIPQEVNEVTRHERLDCVYRELSSAKHCADTRIRQYSFIRQLKNSPGSTTLAHNQPSGKGYGSSRHYRWKCGKVDGEMKEKGKHYRQVTFDSGCEAFEADWESPEVEALSIVERINPFSRKLHPDMTFSQEDRTSAKSEENRSQAQTTVLRVVPENIEQQSSSLSRSIRLEEESFSYSLLGPAIYIIGWTLSCNWDGEKDPEIVVPDNSNSILKDHLKIQLDRSCEVKWHCRVTFVYRSDHDFPDLDLEGQR